MKNQLFLILTGLVIFIFSDLKAQDIQKAKQKIAIGLLVNEENKEEAVFGASRAVKELNRLGGIQGKEVELIISSVEGSWGTGSAKIVDLVFNKNVVAVLGSLEGRNMHMAEQVIAKTQTLFVSAWASEPTLSKAYVPWFFSIVPTDDQQSSIIMEAVADITQSGQITVLYEAGYDGRQAMKSLNRIREEMQGVVLNAYECSTDKKKKPEIVGRALNENPDALVLLGSRLPFSDIQSHLNLHGNAIPVFANHKALATGDVMEWQSLPSENIFVPGFGPSATQILDSYQTDFQKIFHHSAGIAGAYAYDGVMVICKALEASAVKDVSLRQSFPDIQYQGLTGFIEFDERGRLKSVPKIRFSQD